MRSLLISFFLCFSVLVYAQDTLTVYFLHGSKPKRKYKKVENKWFGGILGGHVGLSIEKNKVLNFVPLGFSRAFANEKKKDNGRFISSTEDRFWNIFGRVDSVKSTVYKIPITTEQKQKFKSISEAYLKETPYDYALFGVRCGSSTYEIMEQLGLLKSIGIRKTPVYRIFYPRKLRKRVRKKAKKEGWIRIRKEGVITRKWER